MTDAISIEIPSAIPVLTAPWNDLNPRYVAYCRAHGASSPDEMRERDRKAWPGGSMCGFILWMKERWGSWYGVAKSRGRHPGPILSDEDYRDFDEWMWEEMAKAPETIR